MQNYTLLDMWTRENSPSGSDVNKAMRSGKLQNFQFLFVCDRSSADPDIVSLETVVKRPDLKLCNYHMFRTIN